MYKLEVSVQLTDQSESGNALGEHSLNSGVGEGVAGRGAEAWGKKGRGGGGDEILRRITLQDGEGKKKTTHLSLAARAT